MSWALFSGSKSRTPSFFPVALWHLGHVGLCGTVPGCAPIRLAPTDKCLGCFYFFPWTDGAVENIFIHVSLVTCQSNSETESWEWNSGQDQKFIFGGCCWRARCKVAVPLSPARVSLPVFSMLTSAMYYQPFTYYEITGERWPLALILISLPTHFLCS